MPVTTANSFASEAREHLFSHILPFWIGPAVDHERGGWMAWLANDLKPDRAKPKGLIVHARILWTFSAVYRIRAETLYREMAERAFDYLMSRFWDPDLGGAFWQLNDRGERLDDSKKIYGQAFCIFALAEFHHAFGSPAALDRARQVFRLIEQYARDNRQGGYVEVCRRDWSEAGPEARLSEKDLSEKKSMNNHLHLLEAYTNLHRVWKDPLLTERLRELVELFLTRILDTRTQHFHHFFDEQWRVRSDSYTFGHDIEGSWLLCEAADELGDAQLLGRVRSVAAAMAEVVWSEGVDADGGLCYEGRAGRVIDAGKECWPQAEAVVGFLNAWQLSGEVKFFEAAHRVWRYAQAHLVDRAHGEWFWRVNEDGKPDQRLPKVSEWKGPYHISRACLETLKRLGAFSANRPPSCPGS